MAGSTTGPLRLKASGSLYLSSCWYSAGMTPLRWMMSPCRPTLPPAYKRKAFDLTSAVYNPNIALQELRLLLDLMVERRMLCRSLELAGIAASSKLMLEGVCGTVGYPYFSSQRLMWGSLACVKLMPLLKSNEKLESCRTCEKAEKVAASNARIKRPNGFIAIKLEQNGRSPSPLTIGRQQHCAPTAPSPLCAH